MTFPRKLGVLFIAVATLATLAYKRGWTVPSLRWLYSFGADPNDVRTAGVEKVLGLTVDMKWWLGHQAEIVGWILCGILALVGLLMIVFGGGFHWNPLTLRKLERFRSIGRGYLSFKVLVFLVALAMLDQVLVGRRALAVRHEGQWHFPAFRQGMFTEEDFGGEGEQEADYRRLKERLEAGHGGDLVILPPVPWDPTFDSDEKLQRVLPVIDGIIYDHRGREPYNGYAVCFQQGNPDLKVRAVRIRGGLPTGPGSVFGSDGELIGREEWKAGKVLESSAPKDFEPADAGPWIQEIYAPLPPDLERRHYLGAGSNGWDILAQLFGGLQVACKASVLFLALTYGIGVVIGSLMGYFGGRFDLVMQRVTEVLSNVPFLLVVMIITNNLGRDNITLGVVILIFGLFSWIGVAVFLRTATYKEKARDYASAARVLGASTPRVVFRHILPNSISTIVTLVPFSVSTVIASLTALDFLGFGVPDRYPSWGRLLNDGVSNLESPWIVTSVFVTMVVLLLLITFVGEAVREAFDPKKFTTYQ